MAVKRNGQAGRRDAPAAWPPGRGRRRGRAGRLPGAGRASRHARRSA